MSEPEVESKPVSVVGLIEAYEATGRNFVTGKGLYDWLTRNYNCVISHQGKIYMINPEYDEVEVHDVREASEIDAESGAVIAAT